MAKRKGTENKAVEIPILNHEYKVGVCWGDTAFIASTIDAYGYDDVRWTDNGFDDRWGTTIIRKGCHPLIVLPKRPETGQEMGTLAHEACHAVEQVFNAIGQCVGGEVFAHSVGAIVRFTLESK